MKIAFIVVTTDEPASQIKNLNKEIKKIGAKLHLIKNIRGKQGYAEGVNKGIKRALKDKTNIFVIANPDISLKKINKKTLLEAAKHFDIWGFTMKQGQETYYGGEIDNWRMSGGLITKKPRQRFVSADFVSGSLICIKPEAIRKLGFWDEDYFLYYEEVDYCYRAKQAGFAVGIDRDVIYEHFENSRGDFNKEYYLNKNRLKFLLKYGSIKQKVYELIRVPKTILENKRGFSFNFLTLNVSSLINKFLNFILFLFLIRSFSTGEYGIYTLVWAHIGLLNPLADMGTTNYAIAYLNQRKEDYFNNLISLRFFLSIAIIIPTLILSSFFKFSSTAIMYVLLLIPVLLSNSFSGSFLILTSLKNKIYLTSFISLIFNLLLITSLITSILLQKNLTWVFILIFLFYFIYIFLNLYFLEKESNSFKFIFNTLIWQKIIKNSFVFVLISFFAGLYFKGDIFLLNYLKGSKDVGIYSAGYKFFEALMFIPASYNIVVIPIFAKLLKIRKNELIYRVKRDFLFLTVLGLGFAGLLAAFSPFILTFFLKNDYLKSIDVFRIVIFALPPLLITSIFLNALYVMRKAKFVIYIFLLQAIFNLVLNILFIPKYSYLASSYITVYSEILNMILAAILFKVFFKSYRSTK